MNTSQELHHILSPPSGSIKGRGWLRKTNCEFDICYYPKPQICIAFITGLESLLGSSDVLIDGFNTN